LLGGVLELLVAGIASLLHRSLKTRSIVVDATAWYWHFMPVLWIYIFFGFDEVRPLTASDQEAERMADSALQNIPSVYEPSLFGTYSKKIGMWLFLALRHADVGALLYAYSSGAFRREAGPRRSIRKASSTPIMTAFLLTSSLTMFFGGPRFRTPRAKMQTLLVAGYDACAARIHRASTAASGAVSSRKASLSHVPKVPHHQVALSLPTCPDGAPFARTFFGLTGMHMLHVTLGVIISRVALAPASLSPSCWSSAGRWLGTPAIAPSTMARISVKIAAIVCGIILWLKAQNLRFF